ncbi:hypothetical protein QL285_004692 [Trifolium repens]|nr:hypothetical protein QL285_004692 [Trifolium repens]
MGKVISKIQSAFLPHRQILDGVLVVNELLDLAKRRKDKCLFFKVDFERAYDTVNWNFVEYMMVRMGFGEGWRRWIRACIFQSSMSVLVNGSPTEDFIVGKGLRQGDPLSPFLFLIVAEGLTGLMAKAVQTNVFHGYKVSNAILFHTLQFADDTIIMGDGNWDNLWTIKTVLRSFEIVSGLKVNFHKSKLYGVNLEDSFLSASLSFLHCEVDSIPFRFLGIPVGANPRRKGTWAPIVDSLRKRLSVWSGRNLSIGGRVTLINSVLSSLPLYFFSFFKAPVGVLKDLVCIQRRFLWGGGLDTKKMCWVSWDRICQPKDRGGLGIKNLAIFNSSLLCKWKWRCLVDSEAPWHDLLKFRYGSLVANFLYGDGRERINHASVWWRDIWNLGGEDDGGWFGHNITSTLGDGTVILFWKDTWIGTEPLYTRYAELYEKSSQQNCSISMMGFWENAAWKWNFVWSDILTNNELASFHDLFLMLEQVHPGMANSDRRRWIPQAAGEFTVKSTYTHLLYKSGSEQLESAMEQALKKLWKANVPLKVGIFGWRLLIDKLPSREALFRKGIITNPMDSCCVFCNSEMEDINHAFFKCSVTGTVWNSIFRWMGVNTIAFNSISHHFLLFGQLTKGKKVKRLRHIIWLATTWCIWRERNNIIFRGALVNIPSLVNQIIYFAWFWLIGRQKINVEFSFQDWCNNPLDCITRLR